jgi:hypothetical protein
MGSLEDPCGAHVAHSYLVQRNNIVIIFEEQVKVLECFSQEKALHLVPEAWVRLLDILQRRVTPRGHLAVLLKSGKNSPTPRTVHWVLHLVELVKRFGQPLVQAWGGPLPPPPTLVTR